MTYTPGPWEAVGLDVFTGLDLRIAIVNDDVPDPEADALLIASAPDLLEALELVLHKGLTDSNRKVAAFAIRKAKDRDD